VSVTPVKRAAERLGLDLILQPASVKHPAFAEAVAALHPDVLVVVAFKILPPAVFDAAPYAFNLHGSLLPQYRGAAPINRAVMDGAEETGVTTFFLKAQVDTGDIIVQRRMPIGPNETAGEVHDRMMILGAEAVVETVRQIEHETFDAQPQDDAAATPAPKLYPADGETPWDAPADAVHNHIRGLSPYPGAWTLHTPASEDASADDASADDASADDASADAAAAAAEPVRLKLYRSRRAPAFDAAAADAAPGTVLAADDRLVVACAPGAVEVVTVQQPGRRRLHAADFLNGYPLAPGERLG
jgi:methionyl-tRNA formyltransferase